MKAKLLIWDINSPRRFKAIDQWRLNTQIQGWEVSTIHEKNLSDLLYEPIEIDHFLLVHLGNCIPQQIFRNLYSISRDGASSFWHVIIYSGGIQGKSKVLGNQISLPLDTGIEVVRGPFPKNLTIIPIPIGDNLPFELNLEKAMCGYLKSGIPSGFIHELPGMRKTKMKYFELEQAILGTKPKDWRGLESYFKALFYEKTGIELRLVQKEWNGFIGEIETTESREEHLKMAFHWLEKIRRNYKLFQS